MASILLLGGTASISADDADLRDILEAGGHSVTYRQDTVAPATADDYDMLAISETCTTSQAEDFTDLGVPMLILDTDVLDSGSANERFALSLSGTGNDGVRTIGTTHPILVALGWTTNNQVKDMFVGTSNNQSWEDSSQISADGTNLLAVEFNSARIHAQALEPGDNDYNGNPVAGARVWYPIRSAEHGNLTANGQAFLQASRDWLLEFAGAQRSISVSGGGGQSFAIAKNVDRSISVSGGGGQSFAYDPRKYQILVSGGGDAAFTVTTHRSVEIEVEGGGNVTFSPVHDWIRPDVVQQVAIGTVPTDRYRDVVLSAGQFEQLVELLDDSGTVLLTTYPQDDVATWGVDSSDLDLSNVPGYQRTMGLFVPVPAGSNLVPGNDGTGLLNPRATNLVRVSAGYQLPDGSLELYRLATMQVVNASASVSGSIVQLDLEAADQLSLIDSAFTEAWSVDAGTNSVEAALDVIRQVFPEEGPVVVVAESTSWTVPAVSAEQGDSRMATLQQILESIGFHIWTDRDGRIRLEPIPETAIANTDVPAWKFGGAADEAPMDGLVRLWSGPQSSPAGVQVTGGSVSDEDETEITLVVWDGDPRSETNYNPASDSFAIAEQLSNPLIRSSQQAVEAGYARLRRDGAGGGEFSFTCNPNPAIRENDVVQINEPLLGIENLLCRVRRITLPTDLSSPMTVVARGGWNPEQGIPVIGTDQDQGGAPVASISDNFNRSNENLEVANWSEFGYSWNVVGNRAAQQNNDLSFARYDDPLTSTNHWVQGTIGEEPTASGLVVGVMLRSNGQHQGYALLLDNSDNVSIVKILNGSVVGTLDTWAAGGSLVGDVLRLEASGETLTGKVNGATRVTATDSGFPSGRFVGMLGKGKFNSSTPPAIDDWSAGNL